MESALETANGLPRLSTILILAMSLGSTSYFRELRTIDSATRLRCVSSTLYARRRASIMRIAGLNGDFGGSTIATGRKPACSITGSESDWMKAEACGSENEKPRTQRKVVRISNLDGLGTHSVHRKQWKR